MSFESGVWWSLVIVSAFVFPPLGIALWLIGLFVEFRAKENAGPTGLYSIMDEKDWKEVENEMDEEDEED